MGLPINNHTVVYYQYAIMIGGRKVGSIQRFNPSTERDLARIREVSNTGKDTAEIAFGRSATQVTVERMELNKDAILDVIAPGADFVDIGQINQPINIVEVVHYPDGSRKTITYQDCAPKSWSKTVSVDSVTITESVTFWVTEVVFGA